MSNRQTITNFMRNVSESDCPLPFPTSLTDKHGRPLSRDTISAYIARASKDLGVSFYTKTTLDGVLVAGVRAQ